MGLFRPNTAGHSRCLDEDVPMAECAKALMTFAPVVVMDMHCGSSWYFCFLVEEEESKQKIILPKEIKRMYIIGSLSRPASKKLFLKESTHDVRRG